MLPCVPIFLLLSVTFAGAATPPMLSPDYEAIEKAEPAALQTTEGKVTRKGDRLILQTGGGPVVFRDKPVEGEGALHHRFLAGLQGGAYAIILQFGWEWWNYRLVHLPTGHGIDLDGVPLPSPDGSHAVVHSLDLDAHYVRNSIAIIRFTERGPQRVFFYDFGGQSGPMDPIWKDDLTVMFHWHTLQPGDHNRGTRITPGRLRFHRGKWVIS
jgi:hypothetical protein